VLPADGGVLPPGSARSPATCWRQLGDPRRHLLEVDAMRFAHVPAGAFWMGEEGDRCAAAPQRHADYDYWIAETPVSVAQFAEFVTASGDQGMTRMRCVPGEPPARERELARCARLLCLAERALARACCRPAGRSRCRRKPSGRRRLAADCRSRVRSGYANIAQGFGRQRRAAAGQPAAKAQLPLGRRLGREQANAEKSIGETSTPGIFAGGQSPYGCEDLAGNVWEWTRSLWGTDWQKPDFGYPYDANDRLREDPGAPDKVWRVVRGGSWNDHRDDARCGVRLGSHPGDRLAIGFRVVLRSSPVLPL
jgi:formylglycine-generating enzyme required for sulfatase activity